MSLIPFDLELKAVVNCLMWVLEPTWILYECSMHSLPLNNSTDLRHCILSLHQL